MARPGYSTVGSNRLAEANSYYDALLATAGMTKLFDHRSGGRIYGRDGEPLFGVLGPYDRNPATVGNGQMTGFHFDTRAEVDMFHATGLALGGVCEGAPGERRPGWYVAYFRDLDGNKLCAYCTAGT